MIEYYSIFVFIILSLSLAALLIILPRIFASSSEIAVDSKNSPYECGFDPFSSARIKFDIRFYLVAILFIIFDLEIAFLIPWAIIFKKITIFGFCSMMLFIAILTIGFIYEWKKGALDWE